ncbi:MAG: hypothetical protein GWO24_12320, partial [Akkermansiaceae bacterium]|nr:hypothetical protein [Akkermansiaceae bacterium]
MKMRDGLGVAGLVLALLQVSCETPAEPPPLPLVEGAPVRAPGAGESPSSPGPPSVDPDREKIPEPPVEVPELEKRQGQISQMDLETLFGLQGEERAFIV